MFPMIAPAKTPFPPDNNLNNLPKTVPTKKFDNLTENPMMVWLILSGAMFYFNKKAN